MYNRTATFFLIILLALGIGACDVLDVENPNTLQEEELNQPTAAEPMVNGLQAKVTEGVTAMLAPYSTATDELIWVGSRSGWLNLSRGFIGEPNNEFTDSNFLQVAEAEWMSRDFVSRLETFQEEGTLPDEALLAEAYLHGAIMKTTVGDMFSNWAFSDRQEAGEPIGEENMTQLYDQALEFVNKGLALEAGFETELTAMKARILFSRSVWDKAHPAGGVNTSDPLADGEDADNAAAAARNALDLMESGDFLFDLPVTASGDFVSGVAFQVNQRDELIPDTTVYVNTETENGGVVSEVTFEDPIDNVPHPRTQQIINKRYRGDRDELSDVTIVSAREMRLIIAEAALAEGDTGPGSTFRTQINELRALDGLSAYDGPSDEGVSRIELLEDSRQANLYLQGRRLVDMYRFDEPSTFDLPPDADAPDQGWQSSSDAIQNPGTFFPLPNTERRSNPNL